jgi:hypothetical protein
MPANSPRRVHFIDQFLTQRVRPICTASDLLDIAKAV